ncbi:MAG: hypothetical protein SGI86_19315 [Deltaproteobacteria bacterium]|nr:hypothetical protein [Deltaproteobacteria bacterium]
MMKSFTLASTALVALLTSAADPSLALGDELLESPGLHQGYYASLGIYGLSTINWEEGDQLNGAWFGTGNALRLGQMVTRTLGLGLAIDWGGTEGEANGRKQTSSIGALSMEGQWVPIDRLSLLVGTGVGFAQYKYNKILPDEPEALRGGAGAMFLLGASYDFFPYRKPLSGGLALSPTVRVRFLPSETADMLGVFFGLDITWWTGLPKNQLDLPPDRAF